MDDGLGATIVTLSPAMILGCEPMVKLGLRKNLVCAAMGGAAILGLLYVLCPTITDGGGTPAVHGVFRVAVLDYRQEKGHAPIAPDELAPYVQRRFGGAAGSVSLAGDQMVVTDHRGRTYRFQLLYAELENGKRGISGGRLD
jgi:hypothetical protein